MHNYVPPMLLAEFHEFTRRRKALMASIARTSNSLSEHTTELYRQINACSDETERGHLQREYDEHYEAMEWLEEVYESLENVIE